MFESYNAMVHSVNQPLGGACKNDRELVVIIPHMCMVHHDAIKGCNPGRQVKLPSGGLT